MRRIAERVFSSVFRQRATKYIAYDSINGLFFVKNKGMKRAKKDKKAVKRFRVLLTGICTGTANGLFGGGGGTVAVPAMEKLLDYKVKESHATAIAMILPSSFVSLLVYSSYGNLEWKSSLFTMIGSVFGGTAGALLLSRINPKITRWIFSFLTLFLGVKSLIF